MQLIFKLPEGKPPFIGIRFKETELSKALTLNQDFVNENKNHSFNASINLGDILCLNLIREDPYKWVRYEGLTYDLHKLKVFRNFTRDARVYNFGHVLDKFGKDELVKTLQEMKPFVLKLNDLKFLD